MFVPIPSSPHITLAALKKVPIMTIGMVATICRSDLGTHTPVVRVVSVLPQPSGRSPLATQVTHGVANDGTCFLMASDLRVLGEAIPRQAYLQLSTRAAKAPGLWSRPASVPATLSLHRVDMLEQAWFLACQLDRTTKGDKVTLIR